MSSLLSINPATGNNICSYSEQSIKEVETVIKESKEDQIRWSRTELEFRLSCVEQCAQELREKKREYGLLISEEMGKPIKQSIAEIEKCAWLCDYYVENSTEFLRDIRVDISGQESFITFQPIGLVLGIMPWNFPFWQVFRFAIPTIIGGNGAILKHSSNVQGCAIAIETCFKKSGFPKAIFNNIVLSSRNIGKIIENPNINAVTITGSTAAGRSVGGIAGNALKKTVLELGGNDPYIVLEDADLNNAVNACIDGRILNAGQSCISAKRLIVVDSIHDQFVMELKERLAQKIMGDPMDDVDIGPMASFEARDELHNQVKRSIEYGAILEMGGYIPKIVGAFYPITLLTNVEPGNPSFDDEVFGPIFSVIRATNEEEAVRLANLTQYGLGAAVFTKDRSKGEKIAKYRLNAGSCFVNDFVKSDPRLPFGGIKDSGYGREMGLNGMIEFLNMKTVVIKLN